jgi:hypothetical protein
MLTLIPSKKNEPADFYKATNATIVGQEEDCALKQLQEMRNVVATILKLQRDSPDSFKVMCPTSESARTMQLKMGFIDNRVERMTLRKTTRVYDKITTLVSQLHTLETEDAMSLLNKRPQLDRCNSLGSDGSSDSHVSKKPKTMWETFISNF